MSPGARPGVSRLSRKPLDDVVHRKISGDRQSPWRTPRPRGTSTYLPRGYFTPSRPNPFEQPLLSLVQSSGIFKTCRIGQQKAFWIKRLLRTLLHCHLHQGSSLRSWLRMIKIKDCGLSGHKTTLSLRRGLNLP
ncbi:hypothetical protein PAPYR_13024 [Paratrimastix pyriformis]|uniref:Uncharacterized protein n=1 Tax=Paratrimastix pyriformis TaxID=342808 RepID=A0ABQ8U2I4_9EUKA|nr:hypothetical protein PAPYR_13024 [Paratrimastix pyriformis]